jgi:hypothetical protein
MTGVGLRWKGANMAGDVTVAEAIKQLRVQLEEVQRDSGGTALRFLARNVEVELAIVFKNGNEGGPKAWFLDSSGNANHGDQTAHKVTLVLEPVGPDGKPTTKIECRYNRSLTTG